MNIAAWLQAVTADAERRGLPTLIPLLSALARATDTLRSTDFDLAADATARTEAAHGKLIAGGGADGRETRRDG